MPETYGEKSRNLLIASQMLEYCRFAYKAYAQSCQFPMDPFYESWGRGLNILPSARDRLMAYIHNKLKTDKSEIIKFDPVIYKLKETPNPQKGVIYRGGLDISYILFQPRELDKKISVAQGFDLEGKSLPPVSNIRGSLGNLRCGYFQGKTGMTQNHPEAGWASYLGAVIYDPTTQDCIIVFRGSRSGDGARALAQAQLKSKGSPDWCTDMNHIKEKKVDKYGDVTMAAGFHYAYESCKKSLTAAYQKTVTSPPKRIYVTGHSLGGALAQCCYLDITCGEVGAALKINGQNPKKYCYPISAPPILLGQLSHHNIGIKADISNIFHYFCPKDAVHSSPLIDFTKYTLANNFIATFSHPKTDPFHIGCEISIPCDKNFPDAHEPVEVWKGLKKGLNDNNFDSSFWPTFKLDVIKDTSNVTDLPNGLKNELKEALKSSCNALDSLNRAWDWKAVVKDDQRKTLLTNEGEDLWKKAVEILNLVETSKDIEPLNKIKINNALKQARKALIEGGYKDPKSHSASSSAYWTLLQYLAAYQVIIDMS